jgi:hypothetical protein
MKHIINFGRVLLWVIAPVLFVTIASIVITALIALLGLLLGDGSYTACFQNYLNVVVNVLSITTFIVWFVCVVNEMSKI